jgi:hypothetical protein
MPATDAPSYTITPASAVRSRPMHWVLEDTLGKRIPRGYITVVGGRGGTGKTQFALAVAAELTRRGNGVLFVGSEDSFADTVRPRLIATGADLTKFFHMTVPTGTVLIPDHVEQIANAIDKAPAEMVIIDPIAGHVGTELNTHNDHSLRQALMPLSVLAQSKLVSIIGIMHRKKGNDSFGTDSLNGGGGFANVARSVLIFGERNGAPGLRFLLHTKANGAKRSEPVSMRMEDKTVFDGDVRHDVSRVRVDLVSPAPTTQITDLF